MDRSNMNLRGGLPRFKEKLDGSAQVVVAYLGGSITEGAGASDADATSWRALTDRYLKDRYSEDKIRCINAGVGGTNSTFGAHRLQEHVFSHGDGEIDLLFVEFSVNDALDREQSLRGMEGIVRQCRRISPSADICFVYTADDKNLVEGIPFNIAAHEEVAVHYGLPSVSFAARIRERERTGEGSWEELANDRVHPNDAGHALYAGYMRELLELALGDAGGGRKDDEGLRSVDADVHRSIRSLPDRLIQPNFEYAAMHGFGIATGLEGFALDSAHPGPMMNWRYEIDHLHAVSPGARLTFSVTGHGAGILLLCGPDSGIFEYSLNGQAFNRVNVFDEWCLLAYRPIIAMFPIQEQAAEMRITIRNTALKDERSTGTGLRIMRFLSY